VLARLLMSYWKAWTSSWPRTWFVSARDPAEGITMRRMRPSVTPPVPSPMPWTTFVWRKSDPLA
jgi:hypothetical protein